MGSVTVALGLWCKCLLHLCGYAAPVAFLPGLPVPALLLVSAWYSSTQAFKLNAWWKYIALPNLGQVDTVLCGTSVGCKLSRQAQNITSSTSIAAFNLASFSFPHCFFNSNVILSSRGLSIFAQICACLQIWNEQFLWELRNFELPTLIRYFVIFLISGQHCKVR